MYFHKVILRLNLQTKYSGFLLKNSSLEQHAGLSKMVYFMAWGLLQSNFAQPGGRISSKVDMLVKFLTRKKDF